MSTIYWEKNSTLGEIIENIPAHNSRGEIKSIDRNSIRYAMSTIYWEKFPTMEQTHPVTIIVFIGSIKNTFVSENFRFERKSYVSAEFMHYER
jgi:hypothetical protein